jgi:hypothetical protein
VAIGKGAAGVRTIGPIVAAPEEGIVNDSGLLLVVGIAVVGIAVIVAMLLRTKGPAVGSSVRDEAPDTDSERFYRGSDRPAGPDAERA